MKRPGYEGRSADDFMLIEISMSFNAKVRETAKDAPPIDVPIEYSYCMPSEEDTADYLESIASAIRERRLFGFMQQEIADCPVSSGEWIESKPGTKLPDNRTGPEAPDSGHCPHTATRPIERRS